MDEFNIGGFHIKGFKGHRTTNGVAYTCAIYRQGKKVGSAEHAGRGGDVRLDFSDRATRAAFAEAAASLPARTFGGDPIPARSEDLIEELITGWEFDRDAKKKTICQTSTRDAFGAPEVITFKLVASPAVLDQIKQAYPSVTHYWKPGKGWTPL